MENVDTNVRPDGKLWDKTYMGEPLIKGYVYKINGEFWTYAGDFNSANEVPVAMCCYTIGDELRVRRAIPRVTPGTNRSKRNRVDDGRPIDTGIKDNDNSLMILTKTALRKKGITRGQFKSVYSNDSDMNNALRTIENGDNLSWARFVDFCQRFNFYYDLKLYDTSEVIEEFDTGEGEKKNG